MKTWALFKRTKVAFYFSICRYSFFFKVCFYCLKYTTIAHPIQLSTLLFHLGIQWPFVSGLWSVIVSFFSACWFWFVTVLFVSVSTESWFSIILKYIVDGHIFLFIATHCHLVWVYAQTAVFLTVEVSFSSLHSSHTTQFLDGKLPFADCLFYLQSTANAKRTNVLYMYRLVFTLVWLWCIDYAYFSFSVLLMSVSSSTLQRCFNECHTLVDD